MFGSKKKKTKKKFSIFAGGKEVFRAPLIEIPLKEETIIQKSIQFFDDPEPCYIHRGAVVTRLADEMAQACEESGGKLSGETLPEKFIQYLTFENVESIEIIEE